MPQRSCLSLLVVPRPGLTDELLRTVVRPLLREVAADPSIEAGFFVRALDGIPLRVLGPPDRVDGWARRLVTERLAQGAARDLVAASSPVAYVREVERYGGEEGMRLAEGIFHHDAAAAVDRIEAEGSGRTATSRREFSLLMTEGLLDLLGLGDDERVEFHRLGYAWQIEQGAWGAPEIEALSNRYREISGALAERLPARRGDVAAPDWGDPESERIARTCLERTRPIVEALREAWRAGRIGQGLVPLAWSYAHAHCNRLGLGGDAESVLRYFMHRHLSGPGARAT